MTAGPVATAPVAAAATRAAPPGGRPPHPAGTTLAVRITALCLAVAGVAAVVAGLVAARLVRTTAEDVARDTLADQADVIAAQVAQSGPGSRVGFGRVAAVLHGQDVAVVLVRPGGVLTSGDPAAVRAAERAGIAGSAGSAAGASGGLDAGTSLSRSVRTGGDTVLVEARGTGPGIGFALVGHAGTAEGAGRRLVGHVVVSLGAGLCVAALAGLGLARLLARPLRRAAEVARDMSTGRRDLRVPVEGPREIAQVATAVNDLADALHRSESRQRQFLLSVSHELRTPLTAVSGFAESLADGVVTGPEVPEVGRTIGREAHRLDRLIGDLLDLARLGAVDFALDVAEVDLVELTRQTARVWQARCAARGVRFAAEVPAGPVPARTDPRRLRQVLDGLAENALRVSPAGGPVVMSLASGAGRAVFQVRDAGPGLAPEDYAVAFQPGALHSRYRHQRPVGTGIGLALAHGLVARLGGTVGAGPAPEGGACFTVTLPALPTSTDRLPPAQGY